MITDGLSGRVGDTIYRQRKCGTVAYRSPRPYPQKTPCQLGQQSVFKKSSLLGKLALADPEKKAFFARLAKKYQYIYNAAVSYYMTHAEEREKEFEKYFPQTRPERAARKERVRGLHKEVCTVGGPYVIALQVAGGKPIWGLLHSWIFLQKMDRLPKLCLVRYACHKVYRSSDYEGLKNFVSAVYLLWQ